MCLRIITNAAAASLLWAFSVPAHATSPVENDVRIHFVYIGASTCGVSNSQRTKMGVTRVRDTVREWAEKQGYHFTVTGIATDVDLDSGWKFLKENGPFDQVIIGLGWHNEGFQAFVVLFHEPDSLPDLGIPQVVVIEEQRTTSKQTVKVVREPRLLIRLLGTVIPLVDRDKVISILNQNAKLGRSSKSPPSQ